MKDDQIKQLTLEWTKAQPAVGRFIRSFILNPDDAQDILQEVALSVVDSFDKYDSSRPFEGWAIGIARNRLRAHLRKVYQKRELNLDDAVDRVADAFEQLTPQLDDRKEALRDCLNRVPRETRRILALRYDEELKPAAIAKEISRSPNHVAVILHRARGILRKCMEGKLHTRGASA